MSGCSLCVRFRSRRQESSRYPSFRQAARNQPRPNPMSRMAAFLSCGSRSRSSCTACSTWDCFSISAHGTGGWEAACREAIRRYTSFTNACGSIGEILSFSRCSERDFQLISGCGWFIPITCVRVKRRRRRSDLRGTRPRTCGLASLPTTLDPPRQQRLDGRKTNRGSPKARRESPSAAWWSL